MNSQLSSPNAVPPSRAALLTIAVFEAMKGLAALAASLGLLSLAHQDVSLLAMALIGHFHLDPEAHYPQLLVQAADWVTSSNMYSVVGAGLGYAVIRIAEAYGLWRDKAWAEWLAALSGSLYLPFELIHLIKRPSLTNTCVLLGNLLVVTYMVYRLRMRRKELESDNE